MSRHGKLLLALVLALPAVVGGACGSSEEPGSNDDPSTPGITVYSGREPELIVPAIDMYEDKVDRDVQIRFGDSATLAAQLAEEGDNSPADVFFSQDAGSLAVVDGEELLEPLPRDILERVPARFQANGGDWVGVSARSRVIAYGTDVSREELPDSPLELTGPEWEGRVGWAPTNASLQGYVTALRKVEGEDVAREWLEGMVDNDAQAYESNTPVRDAIAASEIDVGLVNHYYVAEAIAENGPDYPVRVHFPRDDLGSLVNTTGVGVLASTDDRAEALGFVRFLLTPEAQRYFAESSKEYPLIEGVEPDHSLRPLARIPSPRIDLSDLSDLQGTLDLMRDTGAL